MTVLTDREIEIVKRVIEGKINREIGEELFISIHTVKRHLESIYQKTECHSRVQLVIWAIKNAPECFF